MLYDRFPVISKMSAIVADHLDFLRLGSHHRRNIVFLSFSYPFCILYLFYHFVHYYIEQL